MDKDNLKWLNREYKTTAPLILSSWNMELLLESQIHSLMKTIVQQMSKNISITNSSRFIISNLSLLWPVRWFHWYTCTWFWELKPWSAPSSRTRRTHSMLSLRFLLVQNYWYWNKEARDWRYLTDESLGSTSYFYEADGIPSCKHH